MALNGNEVMALAKRLGKDQDIIYLAKLSKHIIDFAEEKSMYSFELALRYVKDMRKYDLEIANKFEHLVNETKDNISFVGNPNYKDGYFFDVLIANTKDYYGKLFKRILGY